MFYLLCCMLLVEMLRSGTHFNGWSSVQYSITVVNSNVLALIVELREVAILSLCTHIHIGTIYICILDLGSDS